MNETQYIANKIKPLLKELRFKVKKHAEKFSSGWPDLSAVHYPDGRTIYIEAKVGNSEKPTPLQLHELKELSQYGADTYVFTLKSKSRETFTYIEQMAPNGVLVSVDMENFIKRYIKVQGGTK